MLAALALAGVVMVPGPAASGNQDPARNAAILISQISAGEPDHSNTIPTLDGVPGAGVHNWDIALPNAVLTVGQSYDFEMTFNDVSYAGPCRAGFTMTRKRHGVTETLFTRTFAITQCESPFIYGMDNVTPPLPDAPGPATLTGWVTYGDKTAKLAVPVLIQKD